MKAYMIKSKDKLFATNAENLMEAEDKFVESFPDFENEKIIVNEIVTIDEVGDLVEVF